MGENRCICCGEIIPEGLQVCSACARKSGQKKPEKHGFDAMAVVVALCAVIGICVMACILAFGVQFLAKLAGLGVQ